MSQPSKVLLDIQHLSVAVSEAHSTIPLVHNVSLQINSGETLAVVGESGSGKTLTFLAALGIAPAGIKVTSGKVLFEGDDLTKLNPNATYNARHRNFDGVPRSPVRTEPSLFDRHPNC